MGLVYIRIEYVVTQDYYLFHVFKKKPSSFFFNILHLFFPLSLQSGDGRVVGGLGGGGTNMIKREKGVGR